MPKEGGKLIGVLALQGAFQKHLQCLEKLKVPCSLVRTLEQLNACDGLILPGGESTAHQKLITEDFWTALEQFSQSKPVFGTCCGLILMAREVQNHSMRTLKLLDVLVQRNAFGPQIASFETSLEVCLNEQIERVHGCFIRAPQILKIGPAVKVLASYKGQPVLVQQGAALASTFHPEVFLDVTLHRYFFSLVQSSLLLLK